MIINIKNKWKVGDRNKSQVYILPMLGGKALDFCSQDLPQLQFRNCFVGDTCTKIENKIILLYKFSSSKSYLEFEDILCKHELFEGNYEPDKGHTCFIFDIPKERINDYNLILQGKYSKISEEYKKQLLYFHGNIINNQVLPLSIEGKVGGILYKTNKRRYEIESEINKHLPKHQWTNIDDHTELEELFDMNIECYQEEFKIIQSITPNEKEFNI